MQNKQQQKPDLSNIMLKASKLKRIHQFFNLTQYNLKNLLLLLSLLFVIGIIVAYYNTWTPAPLPFENSKLIEVQKVNNTAKYKFCILIETSDSYIKCLFADYLLLQGPLSISGIKKENLLPIVSFHYPDDTLLIMDEAKLTPKELSELYISNKGLPTKLEIEYTYNKPRLSIKSFVNHYLYLIKHMQKQQLAYKIKKLRITTKPLPDEFFKDKNLEFYLSYIGDSLKQNKTLVRNYDLNKITSITCNLNDCKITKTADYTFLRNFYKLATSKYELSNILQEYCKIKLQKEVLNLPTNPFKSQKTLSGIEAAEALMAPSSYINCKYLPPKIEINDDLIYNIAKIIYYNKELNPVSQKMLLYKASFPILSKEFSHPKEKLPNYTVTFDTEINKLFNIFADKLLAYYANKEK